MNEIRSGGLIKGRTAFALLRLRYWCTTVALRVQCTTPALNVLGIPQSWFTNSIVAAMGLVVIPVIVLINWVAVKVRAEQKAGYTTLRNKLKELEQRDPYLGRVIRKPGEEYLQRADFFAISQAAKEEAERLPHLVEASSTYAPGGLNDLGKQPGRSNTWMRSAVYACS
ncbi:hypothetical protein [Arthrobacter oryzae]|uniref:Uncharacterized protein n=1 Tax=Arthrobacter oryzae TaxID=409290 RepID=A0A495FN99_9MICC|nr:hypothetical protein [Arthrobacter oryzae]RKR30217.1 hypothetical protein C8D78_0539 [Arthrobacter oryzae]